jgi:hypothetical protein
VTLRRLPFFRRRKPETPLHRVHGERCAPDDIAERIDVDGLLGEPRAIADIPNAALQAQFVICLHVDVRSSVELLVPVPAHDADVVVVSAGQVITVRVVAAIQARDVSVILAGLEDRLVAGGYVMRIEVETDDLTRHAAAG